MNDVNQWRPMVIYLALTDGAFEAARAILPAGSRAIEYREQSWMHARISPTEYDDVARRLRACQAVRSILLDTDTMPSFVYEG